MLNTLQERKKLYSDIKAKLQAQSADIEQIVEQEVVEYRRRRTAELANTLYIELSRTEACLALLDQLIEEETKEAEQFDKAPNDNSVEEAQATESVESPFDEQSNEMQEPKMDNDNIEEVALETETKTDNDIL